MRSLEGLFHMLEEVLEPLLCDGAHMINDIFQDLIMEGVVSVYLNNTLIFTKTLSEHWRVVQQVMERL